MKFLLILKLRWLWIVDELHSRLVSRVHRDGQKINREIQTTGFRLRQLEGTLHD